MKIEIWSDFMCPFCYIGKRKFEHALQRFEHGEAVEIRWRSFELSPDLQTDPSKSTYQYLAETKGWPMEQAKQAHARLTETAREVGLDYRFDSVIPANSFDAHRLSHLAAEHGLQDEAEERLFAAHFTEGKNIDDEETLLQLGKEVGLPEDEVRDLLQGDRFADAVREDQEAARQAGVRGVPFFVFNRKYAVSGAQPSDRFLEVLQKTYGEMSGEETAGGR